MNLIIVGCGRIGAELAYHLFLKGHKVSIIDSHVSNFKNLDQNFRGRTVEGDAINEDVLRRSGIENADGLAAVTNSDTYNLVVAHVARSIFALKNIIVRNYNPQWIPLHETFGFQSVSSTSWGAQRIEELLYHSEIRTVFSAGNGEIELYEFTIPPDFEGRILSELLSTAESSPVAITRGSHAILANGDTVLQTGDVVLVSASFAGIEEIKKHVFVKKES
jgi:trk system potassium uptake protein TrkA